MPSGRFGRVSGSLELLHSLRDSGADGVAVFFSGGKDSCCCLDLAARVFGPDQIQLVHLWLVRNLECVSFMLDRAVRRYSLTRPVLQFPDPALARMLRYGCLIPKAIRMKRMVQHADIYSAARRDSGLHWLVFGHRMDESLQRRGMISAASGPLTGRSDTHGKLWPLARWVPRDVYGYMRHRKISLPEAFGSRDTGGISLSSACMRYLAAEWPADYERVCKAFPFAESMIIRDELRADPAAKDFDW